MVSLRSKMAALVRDWGPLEKLGWGLVAVGMVTSRDQWSIPAPIGPGCLVAVPTARLAR